MIRVALLFSNKTRKLWERSWKNSQEVTRCLPCAADVDFQFPFKLVYGDKVSISHLKPFGSLLYVLYDKDQVKEWKFDPRAGACIFIGPGETEGRKGVIGYTFDFRNKGRKGKVVYSSLFWSDPTFFPFRNAGEERVTSYPVEYSCLERKLSKQNYQFLTAMKEGSDKFMKKKCLCNRFRQKLSQAIRSPTLSLRKQR